MAQRIFCPNCFVMMPAAAGVCPTCGADITAFDALSYPEKLVQALHHPLAEVRMRAIIALGLRGDDDAAVALAQCALRHPTDVVEGLEIVNSLGHLSRSAVRLEALTALINRHLARAVQKAAALLLGGQTTDQALESSDLSLS
jgi:HEAT repeat protein